RSLVITPAGTPGALNSGDAPCRRQARDAVHERRPLTDAERAERGAELLRRAEPLREAIHVLREGRAASARDVTGHPVDRLLLRAEPLRRAGVEDHSAEIELLPDVLRGRDAIAGPGRREEPRAVARDRWPFDTM